MPRPLLLGPTLASTEPLLAQHLADYDALTPTTPASYSPRGTPRQNTLIETASHPSGRPRPTHVLPHAISCECVLPRAHACGRTSFCSTDGSGSHRTRALLARGTIDRGYRMSSVKRAVLDLVRALPDDCTLEDVQYQLYVRQKVERSMQAAAKGRVLSHEQVKKRLSKWLAR